MKVVLELYAATKNIYIFKIIWQRRFWLKDRYLKLSVDSCKLYWTRPLSFKRKLHGFKDIILSLNSVNYNAETGIFYWLKCRILYHII